MDLAEVIYFMSRRFPKEETYALTSQIRRAAVSVPSNIAEGAERRSSGEFLQFLGHSYGSLAELETQIMLAQRLEYISGQDCTEILERSSEVGRLINGLRISIEQKSRKST